MSEYQAILCSVADGVANITLNRPERLNAITDEMLVELRQAFRAAGRDDSVRAIMLTGAGKGFCSGQDVAAFNQDLSDNQVYEHLMRFYVPLVEQIRTIEKPVLAAVNGVAAGAGASLALACDLRIMSREAYLMQAFSNIGLIPDAGSTWYLVRQLGYSHAFEIAIEAERIPAERCLALGLVNRVVEAGLLPAEAGAWAAALARRPTLAVGLTKRAMNRALTASLAEAIEYEAHLQQLAARSGDFAEGVAAFREKRAAVFKGK